MTHIFKKISFVCLTCILLFGVSSLVRADYHPQGGRSTGKFNAYYDASVTTYGYTGIYDTARTSWNGISSTVSIGKTTSASGLPDKYYVGTSATVGLLGQAAYYDANNNPVCPNCLRAYTLVSSYANNLEGSSYSAKVSNATHEIGHSLALAHTTVTGINSVMYQGLQEIGPQQYDKSQLKARWGN